MADDWVYYMVINGIIYGGSRGHANPHTQINAVGCIEREHGARRRDEQSVVLSAAKWRICQEALSDGRIFDAINLDLIV